MFFAKINEFLVVESAKVISMKKLGLNMATIASFVKVAIYFTNCY